MNVGRQLIRLYANNLLFDLTDQEIEDILDEINVLETQMDRINDNFNLDYVEIMSHPFAIEDVFLREDLATTSLDVDLAFKNTAKVNNREIEIPRVVN